MKFMKKLHNYIIFLASFQAFYGAGYGDFSSNGGSYDENTEKPFNRQMYLEMRVLSIVGKLANPNKVSGAKAGGKNYDLSKSSAVGRTEITTGDEKTYTMEEYLTGMPTYGDKAVEPGDFLAFLNQKARINQMDSPAFQVVGRMSQQRVGGSITGLPARTKAAALHWMAEQYEFEFLLGLYNGASPAILKTEANGGLGHRLGANSSGTAGNPLMCRNWYTPQGGLLSYSATPATWNSTVNTALDAITSGAAGYISLAKLKIIRSIIDDLKWPTIRLGGMEYRAVCICDPEVWYRLDNLLASTHASSRERSEKNPVFRVGYQIVHDEILYLNVPNVKKFRPASNAVTLCPDFGPGMTSDPRSYTNSSDLALMTFISSECMIEAYNENIWVTEEFGKHKKGQEISVHMDTGFIRTEWFPKDGRTDVESIKNFGSLQAAFYEPGVGTGYV